MEKDGLPNFSGTTIDGKPIDLKKLEGKTLVVNSTLNSSLYMYSLPDLKLVGSADVGVAPDWVTLTPDGKRAYVANAGLNSVSVIDIATRKEVARIPVGEVPKRNSTAILP